MKPEMPKSFLVVIFALVVVVIPLFFAVLFIGNAQRKKRLRAVVLGELEPLVSRLRQRAEVVLELLRSTPGGASHPLFQASQAELNLLQRFDPTPASLSELVKLDSSMEEHFQPWYQSLPDSYGKRKLDPIQAEVTQARERYNDAVRVCGKGTFPFLPGAST